MLRLCERLNVDSSIDGYLMRNRFYSKRFQIDNDNNLYNSNLFIYGLRYNIKISNTILI